VYAVGSERGVHYYAMQFVEGPSLAALIAERRTSQHETQKEATSGAAAARDTGHAGCDATNSAFSYYDFRTVSFPDWVAGLGRQAALGARNTRTKQASFTATLSPRNFVLDPRGQLWVTDFGLAPSEQRHRADSDR